MSQKTESAMSCSITAFVIIKATVQVLAQLLRIRWENDHQFFKSIIFGQTGKILPEIRYFNWEKIGTAIVSNTTMILTVFDSFFYYFWWKFAVMALLLIF